MSKSLPNLATVTWVKYSEDDVIQEAAEEALSLQYDLEVESFYRRAREKAISYHDIFDGNTFPTLFEPNTV